MIWFTSDQHFYHNNVIRYCSRPFADIDHMNKMLVVNWNSVVKPDDVVWVLGDFSLARHAVTVFLPQLNGVKHLIAGNHDHCHPAHARKKDRLERMTAFYLEAGFSSIALESSMTIADQLVILNHMPYLGDYKEERHTKWKPINKGGWLLNGHVHEKWKQKEKMINVGVDVWDYTPVNIDTIADIIKG